MEAQAARKRRLATRTVPAVALVLGSASMLSFAALRPANAGQRGGALEEDPPSLTFRFGFAGLEVADVPAPPIVPSAQKPGPSGQAYEPVDWHAATSAGLPYAGRLDGGTQLPHAGADWVTWNPNADSVPNLRHRLYGNERTIRAILSVVSAYRVANPEAPRVVIGDISLRGGGAMDQHVSHQNGLDVDVYYPRRDRSLSAPNTVSQIDRGLAQDLVGRFVAAGAQVIFVGYQTGLRGPSGVVVPYPNHENHMHVRFPNPGG
jgi:murein endopeptidase